MSAESITFERLAHLLGKSRRRVRAQRAEIKHLRLSMCVALRQRDATSMVTILRAALGRRAPKVRT